LNRRQRQAGSLGQPPLVDAKQPAGGTDLGRSNDGGSIRSIVADCNRDIFYLHMQRLGINAILRGDELGGRATPSAPRV
jgi:hypothetical protein